jgi:hypothetical protein
VGMSLMTIVGAVGLSFFLGMNSASSRTTNASFTTASARVAMSSIAGALRLADTPTAQAGYPTGRFETVTASSIVFYSNLSSATRTGATSRSAPAKIAISVISGQLVEKIYWPKSPTIPATYSTNYNATPTTTTVLVDKLGNTSVFTYCTAATDPAVSCTATSSGDSVASVGITLVLPGLNGETSQTLQSTVAVTGAVS